MRISSRAAARRGVAAVSALLMLAAASRSVLAQPSGSTVGPGTRVRITTAPAPPTPRLRAGATIAGIVLAVDDQSIIIRADRVADPLTVPRAAIARLERADGRRSRLVYAGFGAAIGSGAGALAGTAASCEPDAWFCSAQLNALAGAIIGAGAGAVVGAIIPPAERWTRVDPTLLSSTALVQPSVPSTPRKPPRFAVTVQTGQPSSGPAHDFEQAMRDGGFADPSPAFFGPPIDHPFSRTGFWEIGRPLVFELDYSWIPSWSIGFVESHTPIGETFGYRAPGPQYLDVQYQAASTGVTVLKHYRFVRGGGGFAWHRAQVRRDPYAQPDPSMRDESWSTRSRAGLIALAGIRLPEETRVYLDVSLQYQLLPHAPVGPFTSPAVGYPPAVLPPIDAQFSHWFIAFGPGVRF